MSDECLICGSPLKYLQQDTEMQCYICRKKELSKTQCVNGHYVCNECHTAGIDSIVSYCLKETSKNPVEILEKMMSMPFCHMHGPEHHIMVGASLLTAFKNAGGQVDLVHALPEMVNRGKKVPGGACGFWGACGAAISSGIFISIITQSSPLSNEQWGLSNLMTSQALAKIAAVGGPRCCKRDSYISILTAIDFAKEHLKIEMTKPKITCSRSKLNNQCIGSRCPFNVDK